jgi:hypothetical protein
MAWYGTQPNAPCLAAAIIIAAYVAPGGLERAGGCGLGHLCMSRAYMRTCVGDSTWAIAHLVLRPVAVAAPEGPGEGRGGGGEVSPCTAVVSHWSLASGCKNGLINAPQVCSRGASVQPELEVASGQGKHSQHREWVYILVPTLHLGICFTCRAQVLGHTRFCVFATVESCGPKHCAAVPKRRVKPNAFCNLRLDSARLPRATPTRKACGWAPHLASLNVAFRCLLSHLPRAARTCDPELPINDRDC